MGATLLTRRRCPYCGSSILLGECPIVATSFEGVEFLSHEGFDVSGIELPSGTEPLEFLPKTKWPVLAHAPCARELQPVGPARPRSRLEEVFANGGAAAPLKDAELPPLLEAGIFREDVPARACPTCHFPLPHSIDYRSAVVIGVIGVNRVGKTHLLASIMTQAYRRRGLASIGCDLVPDDLTGGRFMDEYFLPLFRRREVLAETQAEDEGVRFHPLVFDVSMPDVEPFTLVLHDVAGEVFGDRAKRERLASFLRGARGFIFVVDPRDIDDIRDGLPDWILEAHELGWDQGTLLSACLKPGGILDGRTPPPVAVTLAKADLLPMACHEPMGFLTPAPPDETRDAMLERVRRYSCQVEDFLERHGAYSILGPAREHERRLSDKGGPGAGAVTYHAVSALGTTPDIDDQLTEKVQPLNCLDPLAALLLQITR